MTVAASRTARPRGLTRKSSTRAAIAGAWILLAAISGCGKDNPVKPQIPQPKYLPSSTPQNTLENLRRAYTTRDSTGYDSLFDAAYVGTSIDQSDPSPVALTFSKGDEASHIRFLASRVPAPTITLQFPPTLTRFRDAADPPGWETVDVSSSRVGIEDGPNFFETASNEAMAFKFAPTSPALGSPTDTTWKIIRWSEVAP